VVILDNQEFFSVVSQSFNGDFSKVDAFAIEGQYGPDLKFDNNAPDMAIFKDYTTETILSEL
jgi:hypothetical protein